ncbi:MAG: DUF3887 domain-containing protein [Candidatus Methanofastidiosia archaeon]
MNPRKLKIKIKVIIAFFIVLIAFSGCIGQISEEEKEQWITIADPIAENILQTINTGDYQGHITDYSQEMIDATPPEAFTELRDLLLSTVGKYISKTPDKVERKGEYIRVSYTAKFEQENVTVRVVFKEGDETYKVYGLWFDSPTLRAAAKTLI